MFAPRPAGYPELRTRVIFLGARGAEGDGRVLILESFTTSHSFLDLFLLCDQTAPYGEEAAQWSAPRRGPEGLHFKSYCNELVIFSHQED